MGRRVNIPIFIPHEGCPHACVFCNQRAITGADGSVSNGITSNGSASNGSASNGSASRDIVPEIDAALATVEDGAETEIAFFGGSFTGIPREQMRRLLDCAYRYVREGKVTSIRLSTRPDYIDDDILNELNAYGVRHIELGIQSMDDRVLRAAGRGHTAACTRTACEKILSHGFVLGGQMMVGLPGSTPENEEQTAREICRMGAAEARIYPVAVFRDTPLYRRMRAGSYTPLSVEQAADRAAAVYRIFLERGVTVLRVGLHSGQALSDPEQAVAGATHPAMGELCEGRLYGQVLLAELQASSFPDLPFDLVIHCPRGEVSKAAGHRGENKEKLARFLEEKGAPLCRIRFEEQALLPFHVRLSFRLRQKKTEKP